MRVTRICDPDTGRVLGTGDDRGRIGSVTKLGPMFFPEGSVTVADASVPPPPRAPTSDETLALKAEIRDLSRAAKDEHADGNERARCAKRLDAIRTTEYARKDGGRLPIKRALAFAGYGKPSA